MYQFLIAQNNDPTKGDWYSDVHTILNELEIDMNDEDIKKTNENIFKKLVKKKTVSAGIKYLTDKQKKGEKGKDIKLDGVGPVDNRPSTD